MTKTINQLLDMLKCHRYTHARNVGDKNFSVPLKAYGIGYGGFLAVFPTRGGYKAVSFSMRLDGWHKEGTFTEVYVGDAIDEITNNKFIVERHCEDIALPTKLGDPIAEFRYKIEESHWREENKRWRTIIYRLFQTKGGKYKIMEQSESYYSDGYMRSPSEANLKETVKGILNTRAGKNHDGTEPQKTVILVDTFTKEIIDDLCKQVTLEAI